MIRNVYISKLEKSSTMILKMNSLFYRYIDFIYFNKFESISELVKFHIKL